MNFVDLLVAPFYFLIFWLFAFIYKTNNKQDYLIQKYFISAYFLRIFGGIAFACVYFFYYGGGDTLNYHSDSMIISGALRHDPVNGIKLLFIKIDYANYDTYKYVSKMIFRDDRASQFVSGLAAIINIFTFDSFLSTTIFFSLIGFWGNWQLFKILCKLFPDLHPHLAIGCLYLPSILFWTSGLMKDTLCTAAICFLFKNIVDFFILNKRGLKTALIILITIWVLYILKIYILFCFIPTVAIYLFSNINNKIKNELLRKLIKPFFTILAIFISYRALDFISQDNKKYSLEAIEATAQITAKYIGAVSINTGGSFYSLGELDFSPSNIPGLLLQSFIVTFYRPFIWEVTSPLMIFSVMEACYFIYLSYLFFIFCLRKKKGQKIFTPFTTFCFTFAICFAFVVGVTSNNFGTLARYKSLMLPFFVCGIYATIKQKNHYPIASRPIPKTT